MHYVTHPRVEKRMNVKETFVVVIPPVHSVLILNCFCASLFGTKTSSSDVYKWLIQLVLIVAGACSVLRVNAGR
jgi:hypothetical protein